MANYSAIFLKHDIAIYFDTFSRHLLDDVSKYLSKLMRRLQEMQYGELDKNFRFWASRRNPEAQPGTNFVDNLLSLLSI